MDLMEYKAKEYFDLYRIAGPRGFVVNSLADLDGLEVEYPCMVKAQVQIGGRGKAGGIKPATNTSELEAACAAILGMDIKGHPVKRLLVTRQVEVASEWYLSIALDRVKKCPIVIFSSVGGVDIEETAKTDPDKIIRVTIDPIVGLRPYVATYLVSKSGIDASYTGQLADMLDKLYALFREGDCLLCEINPLAVTPAGELQALDAKVTVDDAALYRHPELIELRDEMESHPLILEARKFRFLFIPCDPDGEVAVISNGSGMIMSCIDVLSKNGMKTVAALDLGGGATGDRVKEAIRICLSEPKTKALFINIFGGITRCDEIAAGVKGFVDEYGSDKLVVIRFEGTNKEKGIAVLESIGKPNVVFADGLYEGVDAIKERRASL
ncbi:MAG: ADP-forming succinate--CoA ligase subunit beta [Planctomycetaceae bacterium]|nr:ADP-forming succinate--CoA ligase subunit beta [Planctomycetaceae bacterium]